MCHCHNMGWNGKSAHQANSGKGHSPAPPAGIGSCNPLIKSPALYQQAILAPV